MFVGNEVRIEMLMHLSEIYIIYIYIYILYIFYITYYFLFYSYILYDIDPHSIFSKHRRTPG